MPIFSFSLRPVQTFINQSRRTRDFWAGSQLVAWLAAVALVAVRGQQADAQVFSPPFDGAFIDSLARGEQAVYPVTNRFSAEVNNDFSGLVVEQAVRSAWEALHTRMWEKDLQHSNAGGSAWRVWSRQLPGFWHCDWILSEDEHLLDGLLAAELAGYGDDEPGLNCSLMPGWQELSGEPFRLGDTGSKRRREEFWQRVRDRTGFDFAPDEFVCAPAYVKRRLDAHLPHLRLKLADGSEMCGWPAPTYVPSLFAIAAAPWLARALAADARVPFVEAWAKASQDYQYRDLHGASVLKAWAASGLAASHLDAAVLYQEAAAVQGDALREATHQAAVAQKTSVNPPPKTPKQIAAARAEVQTALLNAMKALPEKAPSRYYAILRVDVDGLGRNQDHRVPPAVQKLMLAASDLLSSVDGFTMYAGGDDLVVLLPLESALRAAVLVHDALPKNLPVTLSAAVCIAHVKIPFAAMLARSQQLLDDHAKRDHGGDSLVVALEQPGATAVVWCARWQHALSAAPDVRGVEIEQIALALPQLERVSGRALRKLMHFIKGYAIAEGERENGVAFGSAVTVATALMRRSLLDEDLNAGSAAAMRAMVERLLRISWPYQVGGRLPERAGAFSTDALRLLLFLLRERGAS